MSPRPAGSASVVICSRDRPVMLLDTVRSVLAGTEVPGELVVVDQSRAPNRPLAEMGTVRGCAVRYLPSAETGLSRARNAGLRAVMGEVAILLDDDMYVADDWLVRLLAGLPDDPRAVATGRVLPASDGEPGASVPAAALVQRSDPAVYRGPQAFDVIPGANVAFSPQTILALGGYDERLGAGTRFASADDNDMGHRLLNAGAEVHFLPDAVVFHRAWRAPGELIRLRWGYGRGKGAFFAKHARLGDWRILKRAAIEAARRLKRAATALPRSPRDSAAELVSLGGLLFGALDWLLFVRLPEALRRTR